MYKEYLLQPPGFPHAHCASLVYHKDLVHCVWYVYKTEEYENARLAMATFNNTLKRWSQATLLFGDTGQSQGNPTLFVYKDKIYLLYTLLEGHYWNSARLHLAEINPLTKIPTHLWKYDLPKGTMVRHSPYVLGNQILVPAYLEDEKKTVILKGVEPFKSLEFFGELDPGPIQGDLIVDNPKEMTLVLRATAADRKIVRAHTIDGGKTWPYVFTTSFECPLSGIAAYRDPDGDIFVIHNNTQKHARTPLSLSITKDNFKSLYKSVELEFGQGEYSYPMMLGDNEGHIHLVYTHNREKIGHYRVPPEYLQKLKD